MNQAVSHKPVFLSVAIVVYRSDPATLLRTLDSLAGAVCYFSQQFPHRRFKLDVIDNSGSDHPREYLQEWLLRNGRIFESGATVTVLPSNIGYGQGHNQCLRRDDSEYHLILNPDVFLEMDALVAGILYLEEHTAVGLVTPYAENDNGEPLFLCKRYPTVLDLLLRGFAPASWRRHFDQRLARYEMRREYLATEPSMGIDIASGCCMLARTELLRDIGGFSNDYFLYFEDFDLSLRVRQRSRIAFVPQMKIIHEGGKAARKGPWHVWQFVRSGIIFFNRHGWRWW